MMLDPQSVSGGMKIEKDFDLFQETFVSSSTQTPIPTYDPLMVFTIAETCEKLKLSDRKVRQLLDEGHLKTIGGTRGTGRAVRITAISLYAFICGGEL